MKRPCAAALCKARPSLMPERSNLVEAAENNLTFASILHTVRKYCSHTANGVDLILSIYKYGFIHRLVRYWEVFA